MFFYQEARDECKMTSTMWVIWQAAPSYEGVEEIYTVGKEGAGTAPVHLFCCCTGNTETQTHTRVHHR